MPAPDLRTGARHLQAGLVEVFVDGKSINAIAGESIATVLLASGIRALRKSRVLGEPRGAFCMMGVCQECSVLADGAYVQACRTRVQAGMKIGLDPRAAGHGG